jgi:Fur family transcriptional regulator, ferric uptake regulator
MPNIQKMKHHGYRITAARKNILEIITGKPLTAQEIFEQLEKKKIAIDLASVYRSLQLFTELEIVLEVEYYGKRHYELVDKNNHHHHLICNKCGAVEDISLPEESQLLEKVVQKSKFKIEKHTLEFFGTCQKC